MNAFLDRQFSRVLGTAPILQSRPRARFEETRGRDLSQKDEASQTPIPPDTNYPAHREQSPHMLQTPPAEQTKEANLTAFAIKSTTGNTPSGNRESGEQPADAHAPDHRKRATAAGAILTDAGRRTDIPRKPPAAIPAKSNMPQPRREDRIPPISERLPVPDREAALARPQDSPAVAPPQPASVALPAKLQDKPHDPPVAERVRVPAEQPRQLAPEGLTEADAPPAQNTYDRLPPDSLMHVDSPLQPTPATPPVAGQSDNVHVHIDIGAVIVEKPKANRAAHKPSMRRPGMNLAQYLEQRSEGRQ